NQPDATQDERAHQDLADLGRADHQSAHVSGIKGKCGAALCACPALSERLAPGELTQLTGKLAGVMGGDSRLPVEAVTSHDIDRTLEHEPNRRLTLAHFEDNLARGEIPRRTARETLGGLDFGRIEHRKQLVAARLDDAHAWSPAGVAGRSAFNKQAAGCWRF